MTKDLLRYDRMVERALRSVVREALRQIAEYGLPGAHHVYITFQTDHPGVALPDHLRERYPSEMTIVLQHQFWDLEVEDACFAVTLSFNDVLERLVIPFSAVTVFADPSVNFGLQLRFETGREVELPDLGLTGPEAGAESERDKGQAQGTALAETERTDNSEEAGKPETNEKTGSENGNVVALDAFRHKK